MRAEPLRAQPLFSLPAERFIRIREVSHRTGLATSTIWKWVAEGKFPEPIRLGRRFTVWAESGIDGWIGLNMSRAAAR